MILDANFKFDVTPQSISTTSDVISTNVYDAGAAKKLFEGLPPDTCELVVGCLMTAGTATLSWRARLVGADNAALTTNPIVLADTGVNTLDDTGATLANTSFCTRTLPIAGQTVAKRYYGVFYTLGGTTPTANVTAVITQAGQNWMPYKKAAVP
jgi:hypothetical protein